MLDLNDVNDLDRKRKPRRFRCLECGKHVETTKQLVILYLCEMCAMLKEIAEASGDELVGETITSWWQKQTKH